eukprot:TRINITY_DN16589_c0_g1_i2.p1 TRINITY_DN16589_c0_g1~~TRINITY_DN16589_c0_g1_i2.p1  ORF type:complete len:296 (-),score=42.63 TRINITY_DN16589_c0_g1_i2:248-1135(-)
MNGRVCLVTGASRGIGRGIALELCAAGCTVYITGRTLDNGVGIQALGSLNRTASDARRRGGRCIPVQCDHSDDKQTAALFARVCSEQNGRLDLLVNNAFAGADSVDPGPKFFEKPLESWDTVHNVGLRSHYVCAWHAAQIMKETPCTTPRLIVNISSAAGLGYIFDVAYGVAKAAVDRLAADMSHELKTDNVCVVSLWPGAVATEYMTSVGNQLGSQEFRKEDMETPGFTGRAVVALLGDPVVMERTGQVLQSAEIAKEFGFTDEDGLVKVGLVPSRAIDKILPRYRAPRHRSAL